MRGGGNGDERRYRNGGIADGGGIARGGGDIPMIRAVPLTLKEAQAFVDKYHRHHRHASGDKFRVGAEVDGELVGVAQCGRPIARLLDDGRTLEVTRLCTLGNKNVCTFLYARCARIAEEMGYTRIITYILASELGTSLKASGWECDEPNAGGGTWDRASRPTSEREPMQMSIFGNEPKYPIEKKQRWKKELKP